MSEVQEFRPDDVVLSEIKDKLISWLRNSKIIDRNRARQLKRCHVDDILDAFFARGAAVTMTLSNGQKIAITPGHRSLQ